MTTADHVIDLTFDDESARKMEGAKRLKCRCISIPSRRLIVPMPPFRQCVRRPRAGTATVAIPKVHPARGSGAQWAVTSTSAQRAMQALVRIAFSACVSMAFCRAELWCFLQLLHTSCCSLRRRRIGRK